MTREQERHNELIAALDAARQRDYQRVADLVAQATVDALAAAGYLRQTPATRQIVKRVVRDASGLIVGLVETVEQVEA